MYNITCILISLFVSFNFIWAQDKGGRWRFENNGEDSAPWKIFHNSGSTFGDAYYDSTEPLIEGNYYLSLENQNNYGVFIVSDNNALDFEKENLAISFWVYPIEGKDNPQFLLIKGNRAGNIKTDNYALRLNASGNKYYLEFLTHIESGALRSVTSSFDLSLNQWNFVAVFYDYFNSKIYLWNKPTNEPQDTFVFSADLYPNNDKLYVGTAGENGFKRFWGRIDDLRISNKLSDVIDLNTKIFTKEFNNRDNFFLYQNYPNPFNSETTFKFYLNEKKFVKFSIYNILGAQVSILINGVMDKGAHEVKFNASDFPSGIYFYELRAGIYFERKKMVLIK